MHLQCKPFCLPVGYQCNQAAVAFTSASFMIEIVAMVAFVTMGSDAEAILPVLSNPFSSALAGTGLPGHVRQASCSCRGCGRSTPTAHKFCMHCGVSGPSWRQPAPCCKKCATPVSAASKFCEACGEPDPHQQPACGDCGAAMPTVHAKSYRYCPQCGSTDPLKAFLAGQSTATAHQPTVCSQCHHEITGTSRFCGKCGSPATTSDDL